MSKNKISCHHFNGIQNECCDAGVKYDSLRPMDDELYQVRLPCLPPSPGDDRLEAQCDKYRVSTDEEIAAAEAEHEESMQRFTLILPIIRAVKDAHGGEDWMGTIECPVCKGKLRVSHAAYNGHVHGSCETEDCLRWME